MMCWFHFGPDWWKTEPFSRVISSSSSYGLQVNCEKFGPLSPFLSFYIARAFLAVHLGWVGFFRKCFGPDRMSEFQPGRRHRSCFSVVHFHVLFLPAAGFKCCYHVLTVQLSLMTSHRPCSPDLYVFKYGTFSPPSSFISFLDALPLWNSSAVPAFFSLIINSCNILICL